MPARKGQVLARSYGSGRGASSPWAPTSHFSFACGALRSELLRRRGAIGGLAGGRFVLRRFDYGFAVFLGFFLCFRLTLGLLGFGRFGPLVFTLLFAGLVSGQGGEGGDLLGGACRSGIDHDRRDWPRLAQQILWRRRARRGYEFRILPVRIRPRAVAAVAGIRVGTVRHGRFKCMTLAMRAAHVVL